MIGTSTRLKRVATLIAGGTPTVDDPANWSDGTDEGTAWVSIGDMSDGATVTTTARRVTEIGLRSKRLPVRPPGTLLFAMYASVGAVSELGVEASWNQALLGVVPRHGRSNGRFVRYWLEHLRADLAALVRSNTQDNLNAEQVGNFPFPTLSVERQRAIADYLDTETARIDALITKKRRMIELISERWLASVEDLVRTWPSAKLKRIASIEYGLGQPPSLSDEGVPILRATNIERGRIVEKGMIYAALDALPLDRAPLLEEGELLVVRSGAWTGDSAMVTAEWAGAAPGYDLRVRHWSVNPWAIGPQFLTRSVWNQVELIRSRAAQPHLNADELGDIEVKVPTSAVAGRAAVERLSAARRWLDATDSALRAQCDLLVEHRQALITAAVTGGLRVPGMVA